VVENVNDWLCFMCQWMRGSLFCWGLLWVGLVDGIKYSFYARGGCVFDVTSWPGFFYGVFQVAVAVRCVVP